MIDISTSPLVSATSLRAKLQLLHEAGELDGGLPIIRDDVLVGLIPAPDLEFGLDHLDDEPNSLCLMTKVQSFDDSDDEAPLDPTDFTIYIDPVGTSDIREFGKSRLLLTLRQTRHRSHLIFLPQWI